MFRLIAFNTSLSGSSKNKAIKVVLNIKSFSHKWMVWFAALNDENQLCAVGLCQKWQNKWQSFLFAKLINQTIIYFHCKQKPTMSFTGFKHSITVEVDDVRAWFPCPFCYVHIAAGVLCSHLQEEHCFDLKNAVILAT